MNQSHYYYYYRHLHYRRRHRHRHYQQQHRRNHVVTDYFADYIGHNILNNNLKPIFSSSANRNVLPNNEPLQN
jgi:hypothetical protein